MSDTKKQELLQQLEDCVLEMEDDTAAAVAQEYVAAGYSAYEAVSYTHLDVYKRQGIVTVKTIPHLF